MNLEEDGSCKDVLNQQRPFTPGKREAILEALSPTSRFLGDIAAAIHRANPLRSLPPLAIEMRGELGLEQLPSDEGGILQLVTRISSFMARRNLSGPSHLVVLVRQAIAYANGPLISGFPPTSK